MSYLDVLTERQGWGRDVTGGKDAPRVIVKSVSDSALRSAMKASAWIEFEASLRGDLILDQPLEMRSNMTIDGGGRVNVRTKSHFDSIHMQGAKNFIIMRMTFDDAFPNWQSDTEGGDAFRLQESEAFWFHRLTMARQPDGLIDMRAKGQVSGTAVKPDVMLGSVTWCIFRQNFQALNWTADRISMGYCWLKECYARGPQLVGGKGHSFNNLIEGWKRDTIEHAKENGQLLSEYNLYNGSGAVGKVTDGGKLQRVKPYIVGGSPKFVSGGTVSSSFASDSRARAKITKPGSDAEWKALLARIQKEAGSHA